MGSQSLPVACAWVLVLLLSFAGWGSALARLLFPGQRVDGGLRLAWGMAVVLAFGGVLCLASLATRPVLVAMTMAGAALACVSYWRGWNAAEGAARAQRSPLTTAVLLVALALAFVALIEGATGGRLSADDFSAYLVYPQKILTTGTLWEAFSLRRLSSYGGQSFLQALTLIGVGHPHRISMFDQGLCFLVVLALLVADRARMAPGLWLMPLVLALVLPDIRGNSTSQMSGVALFLALFRTAVAPFAEAVPMRRAIVLGLLAAAATTLRHWYIVAALAFLGCFYLPTLLAALRLSWAARLRQLAVPATALAAMLVVLIPWAVLAGLAVGTPLYPLWSGNYRTEYGSLIGANPELDRWTSLWRNIVYDEPVRAKAVFVLTALLLPWRGSHAALPALTVGAVLGFLAVATGFPLADEGNLSRYSFAFVVSATLAVVFHVTARRWTEWRRDGLRAATVAAIVVCAGGNEIIGATPEFLAQQRANVSKIWSVAAVPARLHARRYRALQDTIPPGAPMIVMMDHPYLFDFGRNPIEVIDLPGQVSPAPGMPFDSDAALVAYLTAQGFRYLGFVKPDRSLNQYRRSGWRRMIGPPASPLWGRAAPIILLALDRIESLGSYCWPVYDDGKFVAVDLGACRK